MELITHLPCYAVTMMEQEKNSGEPPYNDDQQMELEALEAIFMENYRFESGVVHIEVVPYLGGSKRNFVKMSFSIRFPTNYPNESLSTDDFELVILEGNFHPNVLRYLKDLLLREAENLVGQPMIFMLIEKLKEKLEEYNADFTEGSFIFLSEDVINEILQYLPPKDLCSLAMVNKNLRRVSDDDRLWKKIVENDTNSNSQQSIKLDKNLTWKKKYLRINELEIPEYKYVSAIVERKGTGENWQLHILSWKDYFKESFSYSDFSLLPTGQIQINTESTKTIVGYYRLVDKEIIENKYKNKEFINSLNKHTETCPYLGEVLGYIYWTPKKTFHFKRLKNAIMDNARGNVVRLSDFSYIFCVRQETLVLGSLINRFYAEDFDELGLLVNPISVKLYPIKYLSDLVSIVNKKIQRIREGDKSGNTKIGKRFVDATFMLDNMYLGLELKSKEIMWWLFPRSAYVANDVDYFFDNTVTI